MSQACVASYVDPIYICIFPGPTSIPYAGQMGSVDADGADGAPCFRFASYLWVFGMSKLTNQRDHGVVLLVDQLNSLRGELQLQIAKSSVEVEDNRKTVCTLLQRGTGKRDAVVVRLLKKSLALKKVRDGFVGRVNTVELQIEALEHSDFNRNMLRTMQSTAVTMRKMGLDKGLSQADSVISELEENMQLAGDMTFTLSAPVMQDATYLNDDEMDAELAALMGPYVPVDNPMSHTIVVPPHLAVSLSHATVQDTSPLSVSAMGEALPGVELNITPEKSGNDAVPRSEPAPICI